MVRYIVAPGGQFRNETELGDAFDGGINQSIVEKMVRKKATAFFSKWKPRPEA